MRLKKIVGPWGTVYVNPEHVVAVSRKRTDECTVEVELVTGSILRAVSTRQEDNEGLLDAVVAQLVEGET